MAEYICATLSSRIRFRLADVQRMISCAATRPPLSLHAAHVSIDTYHRWQAYRKVKVLCTLLGPKCEPLSDIHFTVSDCVGLAHDESTSL